MEYWTRSVCVLLACCLGCHHMDGAYMASDSPLGPRTCKGPAGLTSEGSGKRLAARICLTGGRPQVSPLLDQRFQCRKCWREQASSRPPCLSGRRQATCSGWHTEDLHSHLPGPQFHTNHAISTFDFKAGSFLRGLLGEAVSPRDQDREPVSDEAGPGQAACCVWGECARVWVCTACSMCGRLALRHVTYLGQQMHVCVKRAALFHREPLLSKTAQHSTAKLWRKNRSDSHSTRAARSSRSYLAWS